MALNAASHNPTGERTGPITGLPPQPSSETTAALLGAERQDPLRQQAGGQDDGTHTEGQRVKSEKELEKERKKAEKAKKFAEKQAKTTNASPAPASSRTKEKKAKADSVKDEPLPEYKEETPPGQKKILKPLDDQFHKAYIPNVVESAWYDWWEKEGFFKPKFTADGNVQEAGYFVIPIPPPNVTGALHIGHALANALQDCMIRWNRMQGKTTLFLPGCDHAGISTQSVVENMLWKRKKQTRHDLGRTKFTELVWDWKEEYHKRLTGVLRRMGGSYDWSREAFTLDENLSKAVAETFCRLHEEGYIYRENKLINWCVKLNTALSNLEVDNKEVEGRTLLDVPGYDRKVEFGVLTFFHYEIEGGERIQVATTRPETLLGDSAIAVHPQDHRYKHLLGKNATHPFVDRLMPIIADDYVDPEFGTGAVKLTPAHDFNDYNLGKKHSLEFINILNDDGTLNHNTGKFQGLRRFDARYKVVEALKEKGLYVKWENNPMKIPRCSKSKDVIEPLMKPQWWMAMKDIAKEAIRVVENGEIKIRPESSEKSYFRWMHLINDWCLSRQLWWGHRIPAYLISLRGEPSDESDNERWVTGRTEEEAFAKAKAKYKDVPEAQISLQRDPDVLDTWFSSGLWPMSTLGWPNNTHDLEHLFPTSVLETGWDILFFWVARMIMFSTHLKGQVPFKEVFTHSLIRDSEGRKMSKSLGNVIDPIDVMVGIDLQSLHDKLNLGNLDPKEVAQATRFQKTAFPNGIPECGADALRFSLINYTTNGGTDINFDINVIYGYRRFCNKIYQATRFVLGNLEDDWKPDARVPNTLQAQQHLSLAEKWILHKLTIACREIASALNNREFQQACGIAYQYFYAELCDVFIENSKAIIQKNSTKNTLYTALEGGLTMIHPFMPFITEELWQRLPRRPGDSTPSIVVAKYPTYDSILDDPAAEEAYELVLGISRGIRSLLAEYAIKDDGIIYVQTSNSKTHSTCTAEVASIRSLSGKAVSSITMLESTDAKPLGCVVFAVSSDAAVFLSVKGKVDFDAEIAKAQKKLERASETVKKQRTILQDEVYKAKVSEELQEVERKRLRDAEAEVGEFEESIGMFERLKLE